MKSHRSLQGMVELLAKYDMRAPFEEHDLIELKPGVLQFPHHRSSPGESAFHAGAYEHGWVGDLDWVEWKDTDEAIGLVKTSCVGATIEQLEKVVTTIVRQERFAEGSLAEHMENGLVEAILKRMQQLLALQERATPGE